MKIAPTGPDEVFIATLHPDTATAARVPRRIARIDGKNPTILTLADSVVAAILFPSGPRE